MHDVELPHFCRSDGSPDPCEQVPSGRIRQGLNYLFIFSKLVPESGTSKQTEVLDQSLVTLPSVTELWSEEPEPLLVPFLEPRVVPDVRSLSRPPFSGRNWYPFVGAVELASVAGFQKACRCAARAHVQHSFKFYKLSHFETLKACQVF